MAWDAHREFKERAAEARKALHYVCGDLSKRVPTVGKHEARNHEHLRRIYAEAKDEFPRFADTLAWLLWRDIIDSDRLAALTEPENARLRAERDAAWQAGAEAMREAAAAAAVNVHNVRIIGCRMGSDWINGHRIGSYDAHDAIRALPIPSKEGET